MPRPRAVLFDIGGVVVASPMLAIESYESAHSIPSGWINYSISRSPAWSQIERGLVAMDASFFSSFTSDLNNTRLWPAFLASKQLSTSLPLPQVDGEKLYWAMMQKARTPDPFIYPAVLRLKQSGIVLVGALSNTSIFPADHELAKEADVDVKKAFDPFISSAHIGLRKPQPEIYQYALDRLREKLADIMPQEVLFLDDIGANLKPAAQLGFRTIKVPLGKTREVVVKLEEVFGVKLLDENSTSDSKL